MPPGWCREIADDIAGVDEAMRLGYNWKWGPFELIDQLGAGLRWPSGWRGDGHAVPPLLDRGVDGKTFYRVEDGKRQFLAATANTHDVVRPEGVLLLEDIKLAAQAAAEERLRRAVGHRRRRRLPRVHRAR